MRSAGFIPVSQWCVELGIFYTRLSRVSKSRSALLLCNYCTIAVYFVCCMALTLFICGDVKLNPDPRTLNLLIYFHFVTAISTAFLPMIFPAYH